MLLIVTINVYSQSYTVESAINECIGYLNKSVPKNGFERLDKTTYIKSIDHMTGTFDCDYFEALIALDLEGNKVSLSYFGFSFDTYSDAVKFNKMFYDYFDEHYSFLQSLRGKDYYNINDSYIATIVSRPEKNKNSVYVGSIGFVTMEAHNEDILPGRNRRDPR